MIAVAPAIFLAPESLLLKLNLIHNTINWLHIQDFELDAAFELGLLKGRWLRRLAESWERRTLRGFKRMSSISTAMVQRLASKGVTSSHCALLPNWVDLKAIQPQRGCRPYRQ